MPRRTGRSPFRHAESPVDPVEQLDEPPAEPAFAATVAAASRRSSPARIPPDEALVDQSSTPWRVFDAPTTDASGSPAAPGASGPAQAGARTAAGSLANQPLAIAGVIGAAAIGVLAIVLAIAGSGGATIDAPNAIGVVPASSDAASAGELVVDVAGAVANPGLYRLPAGSRVGDAITAAGGFGPRVDVERVGTALNLAALLTDGAQVRVPSRDDLVDGGDPGGAGGSGGGSGAGSGGQININSATQAELESLPGIGPVTATKIIDSRAGAPFTKVEELRERGLVGEKTFESLKALVTVG